MPKQMQSATLQWAEPAQKTSRSRLRGAHRLAVTEPGSRRPVKRISKSFGDRIYEQHVLTAPDVAEGFDHANKTIEDWKQSL